MARNPESAIGISKNGRYFVKRDNSPLFWLGDTQWNLFRCHTLDEAGVILENRSAKGFSFVQVMLLGFSNGVDGKPVHGEAFPDRNPAKPNPAYFDHVDAVVRRAAACNLILVIGLDHPAVNLATMETGRAYGRWIGERYHTCQNIIWVPSYKIPNGDHLPVMREIVAGLREGDGGTHLVSSHPDPAQPVVSSSVAHNEEWLAFNCIQTFSSTELIYTTVTNDYNLKPTKPVVMAEGAYEAGPEYGFPVTPLWVRRQAYWSCLAGGHHSYGHNDNWRVPATWRDTLDAPGAAQMSVLKNIFAARKWWTLIPDQLVFSTGAKEGNTLNCAARSESGDWLIAYLSSPSMVTVRLDKVGKAKRVAARWIDPRNGAVTDIGPQKRSGRQSFSTPGGWEDAVLVLEP